MVAQAGEYQLKALLVTARTLVAAAAPRLVDALNRVLLDPLGPGRDRRFQHAVYDRTADAALSPPITTAPADAVLVFDGVFLMRPELLDRWDLRIFVSTALEKTVDRAVIRERRV